MAEDFGDDSGDKLMDWTMRLIMEGGREHAYRQSRAFSGALKDAQRQLAGDDDAQAPEGNGERSAEWAKLDLEEFTKIDGWDELKGVVSEDLAKRGITHAFFDDPETGKGYLLFRTEDAQDLSDAFGELSEQVERLAERAEQVLERAQEIHREEPGHEKGKGPGKEEDPRSKTPLKEKVRAVREYAKETGHDRGDRAPEHDINRQRARE